MAAHGHQKIRIRVNRNGGGNGSFKPCGTCGGTGVVRGSGSKPKRVRNERPR